MRAVQSLLIGTMFQPVLLSGMSEQGALHVPVYIA